MKGPKLLFVHDATFKYDDFGVYYGTSVNNNTLKRYEYISQDITILIRTKPFDINDDRKNYTAISSKYKIKSIPNLMSLYGITIGQFYLKNDIEKEINKFDCVIARLSGIVGLLTAQICIKNNVPCIIECVGNCWDSLWYHSMKGKFLAPFAFYKTKNVIRNANYVIYVTQSYLQRLFPTYGKSVGCSNVTIEDNYIPDFNLRLSRFEKRLGKKIIIGSAGKIDLKYKGYQHVIKAVKELDRLGIHIEYQLVGSGNPNYLQNIAAEEGVLGRIKFLGVMSHEQVLNWMREVDIYAQPSDTEGLPRALIEAMSRGCACIGSDAGGIKELLNKNVIFKRGDIDGLIKALTKVIENYKEFCHICYEKSKDYNINKINSEREIFFKHFIEHYGLNNLK